MTEREAFLAAILAAPADDLPRLVFADWLDENGEPERGEFIRVQCELAKLGSVWNPGRHSTGPVCRCPVCDLRRRERELLAAYGEAWAPPPTGYTRTVVTVSGPNAGSTAWIGWEVGHLISLVVTRGWVDEVRCRLADWVSDGGCGRCDGMGRIDLDGSRCGTCGGSGMRPGGVGPRLVREHPLERVVLTDREPEPNRNVAHAPLWVWSPVGTPAHQLPPDWFDPSDGFAAFLDRDSALRWASDRAIEWAKAQPA